MQPTRRAKFSESAAMDLRPLPRSSDTTDMSAADGAATSWRRVRRTVGVVSLAGLLVALVWSLTAASPSTRVSDDLRAQLRQSDPAESAQFTHITGGTRVMECAMRNLRYGGITDPDAGRLLVWLGERPAPDDAVAIADRGSVLLHRTLLDDPPFDSDWISFSRPLSDADRATIIEITGQPLGADLVAPAPPPVASVLVAEALEVAASVERVHVDETTGRGLVRYRIEIDADRLDALDRSGTVTDSPQIVPRLDVWLTDDGSVARIEVRSQHADGTLGDAEDGWLVEYEPTNVEIRAPKPADVHDVSGVDRSQLRPTGLECAVEM